MEADTILKAFFAFAAGGIINTSILAWLMWNMIRLDRAMTRMNVHMHYMRKELAYAQGREWEPDPSDSEDERITT